MTKAFSRMKEEYERKMKVSLKQLGFDHESEEDEDQMVVRAPSVHGLEEEVNPNIKAYLDIEQKNAEF